MRISSKHIGKILIDDIFSVSGNLLLKKGTILTKKHVESLQNHDYYFDQRLLVEQPHHLSKDYFQHVKNSIRHSATSF